MTSQNSRSFCPFAQSSSSSSRPCLSSSNFRPSRPSTSPRSFWSSSSLTLLLCLAILFLNASPAKAAITTPISRNGDYIERNPSGTFCYYPTALDPSSIDVACLGPEKGDYAAVMSAHLNTTTSINYFSASLQRLGGPEWPVNSNSSSTPGGNNTTSRKIFLCVSGRAGDYTYQTMCTTVGKDNSLGNGGPSPYCKIEAGQRRVTDGCYIPNQPQPSFTLGAIGTTTRRAAVVTVTRTSGSLTATNVVRSGVPNTSSAQEGLGDNGGAAGGTAISGLLNTLAILLVTFAVRL